METQVCRLPLCLQTGPLLMDYILAFSEGARPWVLRSGRDLKLVPCSLKPLQMDLLGSDGDGVVFNQTSSWQIRTFYIKRWLHFEKEEDTLLSNHNSLLVRRDDGLLVVSV